MNGCYSNFLSLVAIIHDYSSCQDKYKLGHCTAYDAFIYYFFYESSVYLIRKLITEHERLKI